jgi:Tfp pilus assembly protein PilN
VSVARFDEAALSGEDAWIAMAEAFDKGSGIFDLRDEESRREDEKRCLRVQLVLVAVILVLLAIGALVWGAARVYWEMAEINGMRSAINREAAQVKTLEAKASVVAGVEKYLSERVLASSVFGNIARLLPKEARLNQMDLKDGVVNLQGEAGSLETVQAFQQAIARVSIFQDVRLEGIDKRPTETAQTVMFRMTMKAGK